MKYLYPNYYKDFTCIADACPKTCCMGWQIEIDDASLERYSSAKISTVDYENSCFYMDENKRCMNLKDNGLCRLILTHGEDILCNTCASFPRHIEEFKDVREYSLSISCPEVARIILNQSTPVEFYTSEDSTVDSEDYDDTEQIIYGYLKSLRQKFFHILSFDAAHAKTSSDTLSERSHFIHSAKKILFLAKAFQEELDFLLLSGEDINDLDFQILEDDEADLISNISGDDEVDLISSFSYEDRRMIFDVMKEWEYTESTFEDMIHQADEVLYHHSHYFSIREDMYAYLSKQGLDVNQFYKQILSYFLYAYFCGSAYDEYYFGQAQLAVAACLHIEDFALAHFVSTGSISTEDFIQITYTYARELEHSTSNILTTEEYMDAHPLV